jgi:hypothetical protein
MISDVLCRAVDELDWYLNNPTFNDIYQEELRDRIIRLRNEAEYLRGELDTPPGIRLPANLMEQIDAQRTWKVEDRRYVLSSEAQVLAWPARTTT